MPACEIIGIEEVPNQELRSVYIDVEGSGSCVGLEEINRGEYGFSYEANLHPVVIDVVTNSDSIFYELSPENGDRLITTIPADAKYAMVTDQGFIGGTKTDVFVEGTEVNGVALTSGDVEDELEAILGPDDIEVITLDSSPNMENQFGIANVFFSRSAKIVSYGSYGGTKWVENDFEIDIPVYVADSSEDKRAELPQEKTKEGYFVIDCSSLPEGNYIIWSGNAGYLVRIV